MSVTAGTALIDVKPSMRTFPGELSRGSVSAGRKAGTQMGKAYGQSAKRSSAPMLKSLATGFIVGAGATKTISFLKDSVTEASNLQQSVGAVQAVFKKDAAQIEKSSKAASQALGLSRNEYNELASTLGSTLKNKGIKSFTADTQKLIGVGADLSAQFGGSTQDAVSALGSAMRGEMDPIERYGVTMNQAALEAEAYASGIIKRTKDTEGIKAAHNKAIVAQRNYNAAVKEHGKNSDEALAAESRMIGTQTRLNKVMAGKKVQLTDQQKAQAALSLITKQTADAQGAYGRESETLAGQQSRLSASWTTLKGTLGTHLLPLLTKGTGFLNDFVKQMEEGEGASGKLSGYLTEVAGGFRAFKAAWTANDGDVTSNGFAGGMEKLAYQARQLYDKAGPALKTFFAQLSGSKGSGADQLTGALGRLSTGVGFVADHVDTLVKYGPAFLGLLAGYKVLQSANNLLGRQSAIGMGLQVASTLSLAASNRALATSQKAVAVSQGQANAAEKVGLLTRIRTRVATIASTIAEKAATAAKKAGAVATRVLNAVMRMNPIGLVITALTALGVGLVIAYRKSDTFRRIVDGAFTRVKAVASSALGWIRNTGWPWMRTALSFIGGAVRGLWSRVIKPYFGFFLGIYKSVFGWLKNTGVPWVTGALGAIGSGAKTLWTKWISPYFSRVRSGAGKLVDAFKSAKTGIGKAWNGLTGAISSPIKTALGWVNRYFIGPVNSMLSKVGAGFSIPTIKIGGGQKKVRQSSGDQRYATGGAVRGYSPHKRADNIRAWLTAGEFVHPVDTVRHYGDAAMEAVRQRKADIVPRFAMGGKVQGLNSKFVQALSRFNAAAGGRFSVLSGLRSRAEQQALYNRYLNGTGNLAARPGTSRHESGNAADLTPSSARDTHGALARKFGLHFPVPGEAWHIELINSAKGRGGLFSGLAGKILAKGASALTGLLGKAPGGFWMKASVASVKHAIKRIVEGVNTAAAAGDGSAPSGSFAGGNVERWRSLVVKALGMVGQPLSLANVTLRRMNQESGGNPRAVNNWDVNARNGDPSKGLMQVIGSTFRAYAMKGHNSNVYDPLSNILASMRYAIARYGSLGSAYNRAGGYARGTNNATPGPHWVGEHGPELLWFRGGERVASARRSQQLVKGADLLDRPVVVKVYDRDGQLMTFVDGRIDAHENFASSVGRMGRG